MQNLSSKYRPSSFEEVCGQESIVRILTNQIESGNIVNAYLLCGASGTGKTSVARIFANEINGGQGEPIEVDAASNSGVDNVRNIVSSAKERSLDSKYKVFIIDECHGLSSTAWQSFLKCIEEPPQYTIFIFCTTDPQRVPDTIVNRCMRLNFNRLKAEIIARRLKHICQQESFINYEDGCNYLSRLCNGEMRQGIALLEKCAKYSNSITIENVLNVLGNYSYDDYFKLINAIINGDETSVLSLTNSIYQTGIDLRLFVEQFLSFALDISKYILFKDCTLTQIPETMEQQLKNSCNFDNAGNYYLYIINKLLDLKNCLKNDISPKSTVEVYLLNMSRLQ